MLAHLKIAQHLPKKLKMAAPYSLVVTKVHIMVVFLVFLHHLEKLIVGSVSVDCDGNPNAAARPDHGDDEGDVDDDVDDDVYSDARPGNLYIMMQCLCVTKNENFLTFCQGKI